MLRILLFEMLSDIVIKNIERLINKTLTNLSYLYHKCESLDVLLNHIAVIAPICMKHNIVYVLELL